MNLVSNSKNIWSAWPILMLQTLCIVGAPGCGKPATAEECKRIIERITELELKEARISDDAEVKAQVARTQGTFKQRTLSECVGQRISAGALTCIEKATTAREIVEECFD